MLRIVAWLHSISSSLSSDGVLSSPLRAVGVEVEVSCAGARKFRMCVSACDLYSTSSEETKWARNHDRVVRRHAMFRNV